MRPCRTIWRTYALLYHNSASAKCESLWPNNGNDDDDRTLDADLKQWILMAYSTVASDWFHFLHHWKCCVRRFGQTMISITFGAYLIRFCIRLLSPNCQLPAKCTCPAYRCVGHSFIHIEKYDANGKRRKAKYSERQRLRAKRQCAPRHDYYG